MSVLSHFLMWRIGLVPATTQTSQAERDALARHAAGRKRLAEIGVWHGVTTCVLRRAMCDDGVLYAIDPYFPGRLGLSFQKIIAHAEVGKVRNGRVRWMRQTGVQAAASLASEADALPVDFIFIDGDHSYEGLRADWEAWREHIGRGGIVALHDSYSTPSKNLEDAGSVRFTREVIRRDKRLQLVEIVDTLTVLRRIHD